ncbi:MAG: hypothetical protein H0U59_12115 [Gemmatimonadaceae bacterium]|nr:hypothetical protein [Gemmatimonadaceae bacterium]
MASLILLIIAGILATLASFGVQFGPCQLFPFSLGLACFALAIDRIPPRAA